MREASTELLVELDPGKQRDGPVAGAARPGPRPRAVLPQGPQRLDRCSGPAVPGPGQGPGQGTDRRRPGPRRHGRRHVRHPLRMDSGGLRHLVRRRRHGPHLRNVLRQPGRVDPARLRRPAHLRRGPGEGRTGPGRPGRLRPAGDRDCSASSGWTTTATPRTSPASPPPASASATPSWNATAPRRASPTSPRWSTPPAPPASPRAAKSRTATSPWWRRTSSCSCRKSCMQPSTRTLMFLPLAHVLARAVQVVCLTCRHHPGPHLQRQGPAGGPRHVQARRFLLVVPRIFEKVYAGAAHKAALAGKDRLFGSAAAAAVEYSKALDAAARGAGHRPRLASCGPGTASSTSCSTRSSGRPSADSWATPSPAPAR